MLNQKSTNFLSELTLSSDPCSNPIPIGEPAINRAFIWIVAVLDNDKCIPIALSNSGVRSPRVNLSHEGNAPPRHAFTTDNVPNALIAPQDSPAGPRLPSIRDSASDDPTSVVRGPRSTRPLPKLNEGKPKSLPLLSDAGIEVPVGAMQDASQVLK